MRNPTLATGSFLLGLVLAPPIASQLGTASEERQGTTAAQKQARRWVTFLELDNRRADAANGLLKMGSNAVPALVRALNDPRPEVVQRVAHVLRALGSQAASAKERLIVLTESKDPKLAAAARYALAGIQPAGITLIADWGNHNVLELDKTGKVVRTLTGVQGPWDVERLPNGNYLICDLAAHKVVEMTAKSKVVWSFTKLKYPREAQRLPSGNTLIADGTGSRVLEVDRAGKIVWKYDKDKIQPLDAERLVNGNTLIADGKGHRVIEVSPKGELVWEYKHQGQSHDVDRLPNGNTLIAIYGESRVVEVTPKGKVVHELKGLGSVLDADRLPNGHTLIAQKNEVSEYDANGKKIWSRKTTYAAEVNRY